MATIVPLSGFVTSVPETITALDTVEITAHASGGIPPYNYEWWDMCTVGGPIGDNTQPSVLAYGSCDQFWVFVGDSFGTRKLVNAYVPTYVDLSLTATPAVIDSGNRSLLETTAIGSEMLGIYWWTPSTGLNTPGLLTTYAQPSTSTTYTIHVRTNRGLESSAAATVTVRPR